MRRWAQRTPQVKDTVLSEMMGKRNGNGAMGVSLNYSIDVQNAEDQERINA